MRGRISVAGALAAALFCVSPCAAAPTDGGPSVPSSVAAIDAERSYKDGLAALEAGDHKAAEKRLGEVLTVAPKHPEANYYMGLAKAARGRDRQAAKYFARAIKEREDFTEARLELALASIRVGDPGEAEAQREAIRSAAAACAARPCDDGYVARAGEAIARIGAALATAAAGTEAGDDAGGQESDDQAAAARRSGYARLFLDGERAGAARYRAALARINEENYLEAISELHMAQAALGPHPDILNYLGFAHRKLGRMDAAADYYRQALALDPRHLGANEYLGELCLELGDVAGARKRLRRLDALCAFGCAEREALARLIAVAASERSAAR